MFNGILFFENFFFFIFTFFKTVLVSAFIVFSFLKYFLNTQKAIIKFNSKFQNIYAFFQNSTQI